MIRMLQTIFLRQHSKYEIQKCLSRSYRTSSKTYYVYSVCIINKNTGNSIEKVVYRLPYWFKNKVRLKPSFESVLRLSIWGTLSIDVGVDSSGVEEPERFKVTLEAKNGGQDRILKPLTCCFASIFEF